MDTLAKLNDVAREMDDQTATRNELMARAQAEGASLRQIAAAANLSHEAVRRILATWTAEQHFAKALWRTRGTDRAT